MSANLKVVPRIDLAEMDRYLSIVAPDGNWTFQCFDDTDQKRHELLAIIHSSEPGYRDRLAQLNERGAGIFFSVSRTNGRGRTEADIIQPRAFYTDMDADKCGKTDPFGWLEFYNDDAPGMLPNLVTQTTEPNLHFYFLISDMPLLADMPKGQFKSLQTRATEIYGGDPGLNMTPVGVMRLPGFISWKNAPFLVRVHQVSDIEPYTFAWAKSMFAPLQPGADGTAKPAKAKKKGPYKQPSVVYEGGRHKAMTAFAGWRRAKPHGDDDDALLAAMLGFNLCFDPMWSEAEVEKKWANYCRTFEQWEGAPPVVLPDGMFVLPNDHVTYPDAARHLFLTIAKAENMFLHGSAVSERTSGSGLVPLHPVAFQSRIDGYGKLVTHYIKRRRGADASDIVLAPTRCSRATADVLLHAKETDLLPPVLIVTDAPIITDAGTTLGRGYHRDCGGVVIQGGAVDDVPLDKAVPGLLALFDDFAFVAPSDLSRAVAMTLTPTLKTAGLLSDPTPVFFIEADASQAGKGYLGKLIYAAYNAAPYILTQRKNGVGSLDESFSTALLSGRQFILIDNVRGSLDSTLLESMITAPEHVRVRVPHLAEACVDARGVSLQVTCNDMKTTRDLANRACTTRILKKPLDYRFKEFPEGNLLAHATAAQGRYLGCIHSIVREWIQRGRPLSGRADHDMRQWARSLDYIVTEILGLAPLMDGHIEIQDRAANPYMVWLRGVCETMGPGVCRAGEIAEAGVPWPDKTPENDTKARMAVGRFMKKLFTGREVIKIDQFTVTRFTKTVFSAKADRNLPVTEYTIEDENDPCPQY